MGLILCSAGCYLLSLLSPSLLSCHGGHYEIHWIVIALSDILFRIAYVLIVVFSLSDTAIYSS